MPRIDKSDRSASIFKRRDGFKVEVDKSIEMDIDHFARSYLWKNSPPKINLSESVAKPEINSWNLKVQKEQPLSSFLVIEKSTEVSSIIKAQVKSINLSLLPENKSYDPFNRFWRKLFSVASMGSQALLK